jgi:hypothetical protein
MERNILVPLSEEHVARYSSAHNYLVDGVAIVGTPSQSQSKFVFEVREYRGLKSTRKCSLVEVFHPTSRSHGTIDSVVESTE